MNLNSEANWFACNTILSNIFFLLLSNWICFYLDGGVFLLFFLVNRISVHEIRQKYEWIDKAKKKKSRKIDFEPINELVGLPGAMWCIFFSSQFKSKSNCVNVAIQL